MTDAVNTSLLPGWIVLLPLLGSVINRWLLTAQTLSGRVLTVLLPTVVIAMVSYAWLNMSGDTVLSHVFHVDLGTTGIGMSLGLDGINGGLCLAVSIVTLVVLLVRGSSMNSGEASSILFAEFSALCALMALDLFLFVVSFELLMLAIAFLPWRQVPDVSGVTARDAYWGHMILGSLLMLSAVVLLYLNVDYSAVASGRFQALELSAGLELTVLGLLIAGIALRVPLFFFHTWLAGAFSSGSSAAVALISGVVMPLGVYGIVRFGLCMFPAGFGVFSPWLVGLGAAGVLFGALLALRQEDVRGSLAYMAVSHMGLIVIGIASAGYASLEGALLHTMNHSVAFCGLVLCLDWYVSEGGTKQYAGFSGLSRQFPRLSFMFTVFILAVVCVPGTSGFSSGFLVLSGIFDEAFSNHLDRTLSWWALLTSWRVVLTIAAASACLMVVLYVVWASRLLAPPKGLDEKGVEPSELRDLSTPQTVGAAILVVMIFTIGFWPNLPVTKMHRAVDLNLERVRPVVVETRAPETLRALPGVK